MFVVPQPAMWYAAVDYMRVSRKGRRDVGYENVVIAEMERIAGDTVDGSWRSEPWSWMGYYGVRLGAMAYGYRDDQGYLLQSSGISAQPFYNACLDYDNVSRLDVQVTAWYDGPRSDIAASCAAASDAARAGVRGRPWGVRLVTGYGGGDTCYVGKRGKKSKFLRIYDKEKESGSAAYVNAWRFEAELTDDHARKADGILKDGGAGPGQCAGIVRAHLLERGIMLPLLGQVDQYDPLRLPRDEGSTARRLRWLEGQVAPAIDKLLAAGVTMEVVLQALGLAAVKDDRTEEGA